MFFEFVCNFIEVREVFGFRQIEVHVFGGIVPETFYRFAQFCFGKFCGALPVVSHFAGLVVDEFGFKEVPVHFLFKDFLLYVFQGFAVFEGEPSEDKVQVIILAVGSGAAFLCDLDLCFFIEQKFHAVDGLFSEFLFGSVVDH